MTASEIRRERRADGLKGTGNISSLTVLHDAMANLRVAVAVMMAAVALAAMPQRGQAQGQDIVSTVAAAGTFNTFARLVTTADLGATLEGAGPFTVFAPTDAAFARLPTGALARLSADPAALRKLLLRHVVAGRVPASDIMGLNRVMTLDGSPLFIKVVRGQLQVGHANVVRTDIAASNGLINGVDEVLLPRSR